MSRANWRIRPREIQRTIKTIEACGLTVRSVEVDTDGKLRFGTGKAGENGGEPAGNDLDKWLKEKQGNAHQA
jgi:hypothetical protein